MKIAICDDEEPCVDRLCDLVHTYCNLRQLLCELSVFTDSIDFQESELSRYDVVFLDANLGEVSGIEAAKALREVNKAAVLCYVSAFVEYAPLGYAVDAFRYLMKNDLEKTFAENMDEIVAKLTLNRKKLLISTTNGQHPVVVSELVFLESFRHQILLHFSDGKILETKQHTLAEFAEMLMPHSFLRIHKSFIVNPAYIASMKNRKVLLTTGNTLNCGKTDYSEILKAFMLWKGEV